MNAALEGGELVDLFGDLYGEFASWAKDQNLDAVSLRIDQLYRWNGEGSRFTRAGLGLADDIVAGENEWNRFGLDRRRLFVPKLIDRFEQNFGQTKFGK